MRPNRYAYVCDVCRSTKIIQDCLMKWDVEEQEWVVKQFIDTYCEECGGEIVSRVSTEELGTSKIIIGLGYKKRSGKDTVADMLVSNFGFVKVSLAYPLKELCGFLKEAHEASGLQSCVQRLTSWYNSHKTDQPEGSENTIAELFAEGITEDMFDLEDGKLRKLLQFVGTDVFRKVDENFWVKTLFAHDVPDRVVISDVRFPNELEAVEALGGFSVKINRDTGLVDSHSSETALDGAEWMYVVENNGTLDELEDKVNDLLEDIRDSING